MSVDELAEITGYTPRTIYRWECGENVRVSPRAIDLITAALGADAETIGQKAALASGSKIEGEPLKDCFAYGAIRGECTALVANSNGDLYCINRRTGKRCSFYKRREAHKRDAARAKKIYEERCKA
jgi:transcriptional regulator with XRE-family HTH domain